MSRETVPPQNPAVFVKYKWTMYLLLGGCRACMLFWICWPCISQPLLPTNCEPHSHATVPLPVSHTTEASPTPSPSFAPPLVALQAAASASQTSRESSTLSACHHPTRSGNFLELHRGCVMTHPCSHQWPIHGASSSCHVTQCPTPCFAWQRALNACQILPMCSPSCKHQ